MNNKYVIMLLSLVLFLVGACGVGGQENQFADTYGFLYQEGNHLSLVKLDETNRQLNGTYETFDLVEEGIVKTNQTFSGKLTNEKLEDINIGIATSGSLTSDNLTLQLAGGKDQTFQPVSEQQFQNALNALEEKATALKAAKPLQASATISTPTEEKQPEPTTDVAKQPSLSMDQLVDLTAQISDVKKEIINKIEENGWYESGQPTTDKFEETVRPIAEKYFSDAFITKQIVEEIDEYFCYCDAPGPIQGSMNPDVLAGVNQSGETATFVAYRPANDMYSGTKFTVKVVYEEESWKIDSFDPMFGSHEKSFALTQEQIKAYYEVKGDKLELIDTIQDQTYQEDIYIFNTTGASERIAVHSRNYYTAEGKEWIDQLYYDKEKNN